MHAPYNYLALELEGHGSLACPDLVFATGRPLHARHQSQHALHLSRSETAAGD